MTKWLIIIIAALLSLNIYFGKKCVSLNKEVDIQKENVKAALGDIERYQIDSTKQAAVVQGMQLSIDEYEKLRADGLKTIQDLNLKIKDITAASNSKLGVYADIIGALQDTILYKDSVIVEAKKLAVNNDYIKFDGVITKDTIKANIQMDVTLNQTFYTTYKWKFLWWKGPIKDIRQVIVTDNPYVTVKYAEYINIKGD